MNWAKVIEVLNREAATIGKRLEMVIIDKNNLRGVEHLVITGEQRKIDLQTMQLLTIIAQALESGLQSHLVKKAANEFKRAPGSRNWLK